ncbi:MAG: hypothetical protein U1F49_17465 [Rubrivivax sp.]
MHLDLQVRGCAGFDGIRGGAGHGDQAGSAHDAARLARRLLDRLLRRLRLDQHRLAVAVVGLADIGDREAPRRALDHATQAFFERGDAAAELRLGHRQRPLPARSRGGRPRGRNRPGR